MEFVFKNIAVFLIFPTLAAFAWLYGGMRGDLLVTYMPWFLILLFEALLVFPQKRPMESTVEARRRAWRGIRRDPLFYFMLVLLFVLAVPFVNRGLCPVCDYPAILGGQDPKPPVPFAPFCVNIREHWGVVIWFLPTMLATLAARHTLSRHGKRTLVECAVWNAAALAVLGFVQSGTGAKGVYWIEGPGKQFFSTFGYPNMGGAFFTLAFALSVAVWQTRAQEAATMPVTQKTKGMKEQFLARFIRGHYPLAAAALNFFAALATLSRAAVMLVMSLTVTAFVYHELSLLFARHDRVRRVKKAAFAGAGALVFLAAGYVFAPADLGKELSTVDSYETINRVAGAGQYHTRVATAIFKEYPLFGVGGWGYKHFCSQMMTDEEQRQVQDVGGVNVHNDYLQFLCEHGAVGAGALLAIVLCLLTPLFRDWFKLYRAARFQKAKNAPPRPVVLFCFPAGAFWTLLGCTAVAIHAFGDCPLRSAAVLSLFFVSLACAEGYLPRELEGERK